MKGDFSKFHDIERARGSNYNGVLHQQGRVLLDSDWNAQTSIVNEWQDQAGRDTIGPKVAAVPSSVPGSFKIVTASDITGTTPNTVELKVLPGRVWADGLLTYLSADSNTPLIRHAQYLSSPFNAATPSSPVAGDRDAVILEVHREAINGFQKPDELMEPALGGPDTTKRVHTSVSFKLLRMKDGDTCANITERLKDDFSKKGNLKATLDKDITSGGDCPVTTGGGYTGFEHNFYRVEIAEVTATKAMFKWSQFNGGLAGRGDCDFGPAKKVTITANLQPISSSGINKFYLEIVEFDDETGYWRVTYGADATLSNGVLNIGTEHYSESKKPSGSVFFRLWNGIRDIADFQVAVAPNKPTELLDGIYLEFNTTDSSKYKPGDYWTFNVRAGGIDNTNPLIDNQPPQGIDYHRVPLAILNWVGNSTVSSANKQISDCRDIFRPLIKQTVCCSFIIGDGTSTHGDFDSIEDGLRNLPKSGGRLCLLPGTHYANVAIKGKEDITISGCGDKTVVIPGEERRGDDIFHLEDSAGITLENMTMVTLGGTAVYAMGTAPMDMKLKDIDIRNNKIIACKHAIRIEHGYSIKIHHNTIRMQDRDEGDVAIYIMGEEGLVERNDIGVIPVKADPPVGPESGTPASPLDPCADFESFYSDFGLFYEYIRKVLGLKPVWFIRFSYKTPGGIQIGGASERIKIVGNKITGGAWNGITLGGLPAGLAGLGAKIRKEFGISDIDGAELKILASQFEGFLYDIEIEENDIRYMGLNGIGVLNFFNLKSMGLFVSIDNLSIYRNRIEKCLGQAHSLPSENLYRMPGEAALAGIALGDCENLEIRGNRIVDNGRNHLIPVCGIFVLSGEKVDISDNRILNNGPRTSTKLKGLRPGVRGGVVIMFSYRNITNQQFHDGDYISRDGVPAVKVHDNIITQPVGQALIIMAFGPVSVVDNHMTTLSVDNRVSPVSRIAGSVIIINLGVSKDLLGKVLFRSVRGLMRTDIAYNTTAADAYTAPSASATITSTPMNRAVMTRSDPNFFLSLPSGNVIFSNNRTTLDLRDPEQEEAFSSQIIFSLDDVSYSSNQSEITSLLDTVLVDTVIFAATVRTNDNRFQEGATTTMLSLLSMGILMNTNTGNQATHCLTAISNTKPLVQGHLNSVLYETSAIFNFKIDCSDSLYSLRATYTPQRAYLWAKG